MISLISCAVYFVILVPCIFIEINRNKRWEKIIAVKTRYERIVIVGLYIFSFAFLLFFTIINLIIGEEIMMAIMNNVAAALIMFTTMLISRIGFILTETEVIRIHLIGKTSIKYNEISYVKIGAIDLKIKSETRTIRIELRRYDNQIKEVRKKLNEIFTKTRPFIDCKQINKNAFSEKEKTKMKKRLLTLVSDEAEVDACVEKLYSNTTFELPDEESGLKWQHNFSIIPKPASADEISSIVEKIKNNNPSKMWLKNKKLAKGILEISQCLDYFAENSDKNNADALLKNVISNLNEINRVHSAINAQHAEEIKSYLSFVLTTKNISFDKAILNTNKNW